MNSIQKLDQEMARKAANLGAARAPYSPDSDAARLALASFGCTASSIVGSLATVTVEKAGLATRRSEVIAHRTKTTAEALANLERSITHPGVMLTIVLTATLVGFSLRLADWHLWVILALGSALVAVLVRPLYYVTAWAPAKSEPRASASPCR